MISKNHIPKGTLFLFSSFILLLLIIFLFQAPSKQNIPKDLISVLRPYAIPIQPFRLIDSNKKVFTKTNLKGKWNFIFFGYTNCPDVCPSTLFTLKQIIKSLDKQPLAASEVQVIFVSVDPERDSPKRLGEYVSYFNKDFIAVTGYSDNLDKFAKQFSAAYLKEKSENAGEYAMSHTSSVFLINPNMNIVASFSPPHDAATMTEQYLKIHAMF